MIEPNIFKRNEKLIRKRLEDQIKISLDKGNECIDKELAGALNFFLKPIIKKFYTNFARREMEAGSREQIDVTMSAVKEMVMNPSLTIEKIIEKYFEEYLAGDQTSRQLKKKHKNYPWVKENTKKIFGAQIKPLIKLLKCEVLNLYNKPINSYDDLAVATFKTRENAKSALTSSLEYMNEGLKKIEEDPSILNIPTGRSILLKILRTGFEETIKDLEYDINMLQFPDKNE
ncbi:MAG: hypothetical protein ACTSWY_08905 [Promethearchaeota archaeon]